jgi:hypothetical protein
MRTAPAAAPARLQLLCFGLMVSRFTTPWTLAILRNIRCLRPGGTSHHSTLQRHDVIVAIHAEALSFRKSSPTKRSDTRVVIHPSVITSPVLLRPSFVLSACSDRMLQPAGSDSAGTQRRSRSASRDGDRRDARDERWSIALQVVCDVLFHLRRK